MKAEFFFLFFGPPQVVAAAAAVDGVAAVPRDLHFCEVHAVFTGSSAPLSNVEHWIHLNNRHVLGGDQFVASSSRSLWKLHSEVW